MELVRVFTDRSYTVVGFERASVDITDAASVERTLGKEDPAIVLNAAAYNQVDVAENEPVPAFMANALAVRNLAMSCRQLDARFVHFSTDYVFDGTAGRPYTEQDRTHPLGAYGVSKLAGELYAQAYLETPLVIRTSGVFGPGGLRTARGNFIELMLRLAAYEAAHSRGGRPRGLADVRAAAGRAHRGSGRRQAPRALSRGRRHSDFLVRLRSHHFPCGRIAARVAPHQ